jgi:hypothetical protein
VNLQQALKDALKKEWEEKEKVCSIWLELPAD